MQSLQTGQLDDFEQSAKPLFPHLSEDQQMVLLQGAIQPHINAGHFSKALGLVEHLSSYPLEDTVRLDLQIDHSVILTRLGQHTQAIENYLGALKLAESMNDEERQARIIGNLGILHQAEGDLDKAIEKYTTAYAKFEALGQVDKLSALDGNLGTLYKEQGYLEQAMQHFDRAIEHTAKLGSTIHHGVFLGNRAICLQELNESERAERELRQAIDICDQHLEFAAGAFRSELALMICATKPMDARALLAKGESQVHEHKEQYGKFLCQKAEITYQLRDYETCKDALREAETLCKHLNVRRSSALYQTLVHTQQEIPAHIWLSSDEIEERSLVARVNLQWGRYETASSRYPQALHHLDLAEALFDILDNVEHLLNTRYSQSIVYSHNGELNRAIQVASAVQKERLVRGDRIEYAETTNFLGGCYRRLGQLDKSLELHEESLEIFEEFQHIGMVNALEKAALVCRTLGEYQRALNYMERALEQAIKNNMRIGTLYCNVGLCHNVMGNEEQALHYYHLGIQDLRKLGDQNREMLYLGNIANIYMRQEKYVQAESIFEDIITRAQELGIQSNECINRGNYGEMLLQTGRWDEADVQLTRAIELGMEIYPIASGVFTGTLAKLRSLQERHQEAMALLEQEIVQTVQVDPEEYTKLLCVAAGIYFNASEEDLALRTYGEATDILRAKDFQPTTDVYIKWIQTSELLGLPTQRSSDS
jgi:tetratricopeptide (TPR) repeat protein